MEGEEAGERGRAHIFAAAQEASQHGTREGRGAGDIRAHLGGEVGDLIPGQQVTAEAKAQHEAEQRDATEPGKLARAPVGVREHHAEHVHEGEEDQQVGTPTVDGADKPTELHAGHDEADAVESLGDGGAVVEQQQQPGEHLDAEEEQRDAAEVVPGGSGMERDHFVVQHVARHAQAEPFVEPIEGLSFDFRG